MPTIEIVAISLPISARSFAEGSLYRVVKDLELLEIETQLKDFQASLPKQV